MAQHKDISTLPLTMRETEHLEDVSVARTGSFLRARRAAMLLKYKSGVPVSEIARIYRCTAKDVEQWIGMAVVREVITPRQKEAKGCGLRAKTEAMMDWVHALSCQNPEDYGYRCAVWPPSLLARHVRDHCRAAGHQALAGLSCAKLKRLLACHRARVRHARRLTAARRAGQRLRVAR